ncbi:hypothetical protein JW964_22290, partial [candidate division KSB1 bacterium]|nr:hypothetical protein [candidate division KSB1 bacterium]
THYASRLTIYHVIIVVHCHLPINIEGIPYNPQYRSESFPHVFGGNPLSKKRWMPDNPLANGRA